MIRKRRGQINTGEGRLLLIGLCGLVAVAVVFVVAIAIVARLEPTTGSTPDPIELIDPTPADS